MKNSTLAVVSLVTGILALIPCCNYLILSLVAIATGVLAKSEIKKKPDELKGDGMALAGIIMGAFGLLVTLAFLILQFSVGVLDAFF